MTRHRNLLIVGGVLVAALAGAIVFLARREPPRTLPAEFVRQIETSAGSLTMVRFAPDGKSLLAGGASGEVIAVSLDPERIQQLAPATDDPLTCLAESPDGLILAGAASGRLRAWKRPQLEVTPVASPKVAVTAAAFGIERTERRLVLGLSDGRIVITSPEGEHVRKTKHRGVKSSGDWDGRLKILEVRTHTEVAGLQLADAVSGLAWPGERLISASWDGMIRSWRYESGKLIDEYSFDTGAPIHSLTASPDGSLLATAHGGTDVVLWQFTNDQ
jgi:WD40 repeat protein